MLRPYALWRSGRGRRLFGCTPDGSTPGSRRTCSVPLSVALTTPQVYGVLVDIAVSSRLESFPATPREVSLSSAIAKEGLPLPTAAREGLPLPIAEKNCRSPPLPEKSFRSSPLPEENRGVVAGWGRA